MTCSCRAGVFIEYPRTTAGLRDRLRQIGDGAVPRPSLSRRGTLLTLAVPSRPHSEERAAHGLDAMSQGTQVEVELIDDTANYQRLTPASLPIAHEDSGVWTDVQAFDPIARAFLHEARVRKARWEAATPQARALVLGAIRAHTAIQKAVQHLLQGPKGSEPDSVLQLAAEPFLQKVVRNYESSRSDANGFQRQFERYVFLARANDVLPRVERVLTEIRDEVQHMSEDDETWLSKAQERVQALLQHHAERTDAFTDMRKELKLLHSRMSTTNIAVRIVAHTSGLSEDDVRTGVRRFRPNTK